jgi:RNA polymerase sigma-54 factor
MALTPKIEIRQSQRLFITPQMQQSIGLLQMSGLELAEFVENEL